jgi:hypothetical protein
VAARGGLPYLRDEADRGEGIRGTARRRVLRTREPRFAGLRSVWLPARRIARRHRGFLPAFSLEQVLIALVSRIRWKSRPIQIQLHFFIDFDLAELRSPGSLLGLAPLSRRRVPAALVNSRTRGLAFLLLPGSILTALAARRSRGGPSQFSPQVFHNVQQQADDGARALILDAGQIDLLNLIEQGIDARGLGRVLRARIRLVWLTARSARSEATHPFGY